MRQTICDCCKKVVDEVATIEDNAVDWNFDSSNNEALFAEIRQEIPNIDYGHNVRVRCQMKDGEYCYECLDYMILHTKKDHVNTRCLYVAWKRMLTCQCEQHAALRNDGHTLLAMYKELRS